MPPPPGYVGNKGLLKKIVLDVNHLAESYMETVFTFPDGEIGRVELS